MRRAFLVLTVLFAALFCTRAGATIVINELMLSTATYESGHAYEWIELYNDSSKAVSLYGMTLTYVHKDQISSFTFQSTTKLKAHGYAIVYFTNYDKKASSGNTYYAPFDVSKKGGTFTITDKGGQLVTELTVGRQYCDVSWGLVSGTNEYRYLS